MTLRSKLILAFVLMSVVPLTAVTVLSYGSSIAAFRQTVESEAERLTDEMGQRMELVTEDLGRRIDRLGELPFEEVRTASARDWEGTGEFLQRFIETMGERSSLVEALEYVPLETAGAPAAPGEVFVIDLSEVWSHTKELGQAIEAGTQAVEQLGNVLPGVLESVLPPGEAAEVNRVLREQLGDALKEARVEIERARAGRPPPQAPPGAEPVRPPAAVPPAPAEPPAAGMAALGTTAHQPRDAVARRLAGLGPDLGSPVLRGDDVIGRVHARIDAGRVLRSVLSRTRTDQGEIPFALDAEGQLYTLEATHTETLEDFDLGRGGGGPAGGDWVVVTREEPALGIAFGIARPVGGSLDEIRRAAGRNLLWGLGFIGLALLGVVPLSSRMTRNLGSLTDGVDRLARGDLTTRVDIRSGDEIGRLGRAFNSMAGRLSEQQRQVVERERLRKELEMCRSIQEELLPARTGRLPFAEVRALSIPAREVGGDFFNYFALPDGSAALLMGDVSGKGVPAALLMANLQATLRARLPLESDLALLAETLDLEIEASTRPESYLTLFVGLLDPDGRGLRYVNAGHNAQYLCRRDGSLERLAATGRPLGLLAGGGYAERRIELAGGDRLCLFTDGLVEAEDASGEAFGARRVEQLLQESNGDEANDLVQRIEQAVARHRAGAEADDDATVLVLRVDSPGVAAHGADRRSASG